MNKTPDTCTIILGMHRSGTSALAGCLNLMGVNFGRAMMPAHTSNESGFFENQDIVLAHDIFFRDLGCSWDMVGSLPQEWEKSQAAEKARQTLSNILERQFLDDNKPFAIKDPRLCRLMPLWEDILEELGIKPSFVIMVRHPMEVARSLEKRDGHDLLKGHLLWMVHNREALRACRLGEHVIITFDQVLADPVNSLVRTCSLPSLAGLEPMKYSRDILEFIRPEFKHHHQGAGTNISDSLFAHYSWVYDQFKSLQARMNISRVEAGQDSSGSTLPMAEEFSKFPLTFSVSSAARSSSEQTHASAIFNNLMDIIGKFEQTDHDRKIREKRLLLASSNVAETIYAQVYFPVQGPDGTVYQEQDSRKFLLAPDEWQTLRLDIPRPEMLRGSSLRFDPLNTRGMINVSNIRLVSSVNEKEFWSAAGDFSACTVEGDAIILKSRESLEVVSTGNDPRILLPGIPDLPDSPLSLEIWLKAGRSQKRLNQLLKDLSKKLQELKKNLEQKTSQLQGLDKNLEQQKKSLKKQEELTREYQSLLTLAEQNHEMARYKLSRVEKDLEQKNSQTKELTLQLQNQKQLQNELEQHKKNLKKQEELTREYQSLLTLAEQNHQKASLEIARLEKDLEQKNSQTQELKKNLDKQDQELTLQIQNLKQLQNELEQQKKSLKNKDDLSREYFDALSRADEENNALSSDLDQTRQLLDKQKKNHNQLQKQRDALASELDQSRLLLDKQKKNHNQLQKQRDALASELEQTRQLLDKQIKNRDSLKKENNTLSHELGNIRQLLDKQIKDRNQLQKERDALSGNLDQTRQLLDKNQKQIEQDKALIAQKNILARKYAKALARAEEEQEIFRERSRLLHAGNKQFIAWMRRLHKDHIDLMNSTRWRAGNRIIRTLEIFLLRGKKPMASDDMEKIFNAFKDREEYLKSSAPEKLVIASEPAPKEMITWMRQLNIDFKALKTSKRWKLGSFFARAIDILIFRYGKKTAVDNLEKIFHEHEAELKDSSSLDRKRLEKRLRVAGKDFRALQNSRRWRVGNTFFSVIDRLILRGKKPTAMDHALQVTEKIEKLKT